MCIAKDNLGLVIFVEFKPCTSFNCAAASYVPRLWDIVVILANTLTLERSRSSSAVINCLARSSIAIEQVGVNFAAPVRLSRSPW